MKVAVDGSALAYRSNGIGRYVTALLAEMRRTDDRDYVVYARAPTPGVPTAPRWRARHDHLPAAAGPLSLVTSLPLWAALDEPDLYWGPAHRLPIRLPTRTARVVTVHDLCWLREPSTMKAATRRLDAWWMPRAIAAADRIIAVCAAGADDIRAAFPAHADRVRVVHEAAFETDAADPSALQMLGVRHPYVLFVGTQEPRKNLLRLLEAYARARVALPETSQLVLAGASGWGGLRLPDMLQRLQLHEHVVLTGRVDDGALAALYAGAMCLALPSLYEGFGLPLVEAMAHGTPVLTSNVASMPEIAGDAGVLVDPRDVDSIARGLVQLLGDPALRARLSANARVQAARFSWKRACRETLAVFDEAVEVRGARRR